MFPHQRGGAEVEALLTATGGSDPILLRPRVADAAGEYVLLPDDPAERWDAAELAIARRTADIELFSTLTHRDGEDETAAYAVRVDQVAVGRWAASSAGRSAVTWDGAGEVCRVYIEGGGMSEPTATFAEIRSVVPLRRVAGIRAELPPLRIPVGAK